MENNRELPASTPTPTPPNPLFSLFPSHSDPLYFYFLLITPYNINLSFLLFLLTTHMSLLSEFSLTADLPTSLPILPFLSSVHHHHHHVVCGSDYFSPSAPSLPAAVCIFLKGGWTRMSLWTSQRRHEVL